MVSGSHEAKYLSQGLTPIDWLFEQIEKPKMQEMTFGFAVISIRKLNAVKSRFRQTSMKSPNVQGVAFGHAVMAIRKLNEIKSRFTPDLQTRHRPPDHVHVFLSD